MKPEPPILAKLRDGGDGVNHYMHAGELTALAAELAELACVVNVRYFKGGERDEINIHISYHPGLDNTKPR